MSDANAPALQTEPAETAAPETPAEKQPEAKPAPHQPIGKDMRNIVLGLIWRSVALGVGLGLAGAAVLVIGDKIGKAIAGPDEKKAPVIEQKYQAPQP